MARTTAAMAAAAGWQVGRMIDEATGAGASLVDAIDNYETHVVPIIADIDAGFGFEGRVEFCRSVVDARHRGAGALSPDEATLYVTNGLSDDMTLVDTREGKAIRTVAAGRVPHTPLVAP